MKSTSKKVTKTDNSSPERKIYLRNKFTQKNAHVLDLFCGSGIVYNSCYRDANLYHGIDHEKIHTPGICEIGDNLRWIRKNDLSEYDTIDLDDYGSPWLLFFIVLKKLQQKEITVFLTDGSPLHMKMSSQVSKLISSTEGTPKKFKIPGIFRFYIDIITTMLLQIPPKMGYQVTEIYKIPNPKGTVCYWCLKLCKI